MSPFIRGGLFLAGFAGAVGLGYALKPTPAPAKAAPPTVVLNIPPAPSESTILHPPRIEPGAEIVIPPPSARDVASERVNKNDLAFQVIQQELGIKTTLDDKPPAVLVAQAGSPSPLPPPSLPPVPDLSPPPLPSEDAFKLPPVPVIALPEAPPLPGVKVDPPPPSLKLILNTRAVAFNFEVTKVGPSKVKAVELWATRDGGKTWEKYDRMLGDKPPFRTDLRKSDLIVEGEYGFKLVFESEAGMRSVEPTSGTRPDLMAELDMTPPVVKIFSPKRHETPGTILLRWTMADKNLDPTRTLFEYSPDGVRWVRIMLGDLSVRHGALTNERGFPTYEREWKVPDGVGHAVRMRVTAFDWAGNETRAETADRVSVDLVVPEGKLTGVQPQRPGETGPMPRVVADRQVFSFYSDFVGLGGR